MGAASVSIFSFPGNYIQNSVRLRVLGMLFIKEARFETPDRVRAIISLKKFGCH